MIKYFIHIFGNSNIRHKGYERTTGRCQSVIAKKIINRMWITSRTSRVMDQAKSSLLGNVVLSDG